MKSGVGKVCGCLLGSAMVMEYGEQSWTAKLILRLVLFAPHEHLKRQVVLRGVAYIIHGTE